MRRREFLTLVAGASILPSAGAGAQQSTKVCRIAMLHPSYAVSEMTETSSLPSYRSFVDELRRLGYIEGRNLLIDRYSAEGLIENYPALALTVVSHNPDLIFTVGSPMAKALKEETSSIPIVLAASARAQPDYFISDLHGPFRMTQRCSRLSQGNVSVNVAGVLGEAALGRANRLLGSLLQDEYPSLDMVKQVQVRVGGN